MGTRYEIDREEATRLIRLAEETGRAIEEVVFPLMDVRSKVVRGVTFVDCDVGRLGFVGPLFRTAQLIDCAFVRSRGPHHVRYKGVRFTRCRWEGGRLSGSMSGATLQDCRISDTEIDDLNITKSTLQASVLAGLTGQGLILRDSNVHGVSISGRLDHVSLVDLAVSDLDLSSFHVRDGGLLGLRGHGTLPDFEDSFVVTAEAIAGLKPELHERVRPEARPTLDRILGEGSALEWFDPRRLDSTPGDTPRLLPEEQHDVLRLLWDKRATEFAA